MSDLRTVAQQALDVLETTISSHGDIARSAINDLRAALEQPERAQAMRNAGYTRRPTLREMSEEEPEQEPVACPHRDEPRGCYRVRCQLGRKCVEPLFTHPPRREWRGLTEEEMGHIYVRSATHEEFARAIEAALKEKNHDQPQT